LTNSDTDTDAGGVCVNEDGLRVKTIHKPAWNSNEILHGDHGVNFKCEKCGVKFLDIQDEHMVGGNGKNGPKKHFSCGKCRVDLKGEGELEGRMVESSENVVCRECSHIVEALELHWKQVCFPPFPFTLGKCLAS